jgi:biotin operon repressor
LNRTDSEWYHCSSHGTVVMHIAANPHTTIKEIADALRVTERSVWGTIGTLRRSGQIRVVRIGRNHHYHVNMDAPFLHPTITGVTLGNLLRGLTSALKAGRQETAAIIAE